MRLRRGGGAGAAHRPVERPRLARSALRQLSGQQPDLPAHLRGAGGAGRASAAAPGAGDRVARRRRANLGVQAARGRALPRRLALHGRRCRLQPGPRAAGAQRAIAVHALHATDRRGRRGRPADHPPAHRQPRAAAAARPQRHSHPLAQGGVRPGAGRQDHRAAQSRRGPGRHRPVPLRVVDARAPARAGAQRRLLGAEAGLGHRHVLSDPRRHHASGRARFRRSRLRREPADAGPGAPAPRPALAHRVGAVQPDDLPASRSSRRAVAGHPRHRRQESAEGPAGA